jgi:chromosome segregation protein
VSDLTQVLQRDRGQLEALSQELTTMVPGLDIAHADESRTTQALAGCEQALAAWQHTWDAHAQAVALGQGETGVERARIEQLESEQRRLLQQQERLQSERASLLQLQPAVALETLESNARVARDAGQKAASELQELLAQIAVARDREREQSQALNGLRTRWQEALGSQVSTEALQQAALGKVSGKVTEWLKSKSLDRHPRVAQQLRVDRGWERAVETVLGSYLEAVCVDGLDSVTDLLSSFDGGHLVVVSTGDLAAAPREAASLQAKVQGATLLGSVLSSVYTAETLNEALRLRSRLSTGQSVVTRDGIWLGSDWLRLSRDADPHTGVIEREETLRALQAQVSSLADEVKDLEHRLELSREQVRDHEDRRDRFQADVNRLHREHVDRRAELDSAQARSADAARRTTQLDTGLADLDAELKRTESDLRAARARMETAIDKLAALEPQRVTLEQERDRMRTELATARTAALAAQQLARELALQVESRRSSHSSLTTTLSRIEQQLQGLETRRNDLAAQLTDGEAPLATAQTQLEHALRVRAEIDAEVQAARIASEELDAHLRERDAARSAIEERLEAARSSLDDARLAAQQVRIRRESVAEQLAATAFELAALLSQLAEDATVANWEAQLEETRGKIERLGQVNLAAIGEFKEQSERKEYLDRQCKDLTDALETLESAMRKIDRETRLRFQDTFDKVNAGLKEKFPRLFGGGHAYLELTGEEGVAAGVSVMARPPGKRNSTISQLSGGEKALTAVALVFAIFDLNPAPFCLLDEVDAPLDENNVGRFCDIVRDMSRNVQFIFITHNKSTMELASQLVGVTMNEPGVSRLVAVDVDEAVRMAAM